MWWFNRFEREHDNLRAALRYLLERGEVAIAARIGGGAFWHFWLAQDDGYFCAVNIIDHGPGPAAGTEGGKIVEHWLESDRLDLLQKLGVVPSMR